MKSRTGQGFGVKGAAGLAIAIAGIGVATYLVGQEVYTHLKETSPKVAAAVGAPKPVMVKEVLRGELKQMLGAEATAAESQLVPIRTSLMTATVIERGARIGDVVRRGQLLVKFDSSLQIAKLNSAQSDLKTAQGDLELIKARLDTLRTLNQTGLASNDELRIAALQESEIRGRMTAATLKSDEAVNELRATQITAPAGGVVTDGELYPGMVVRGGTDLMMLRVIDPIYVTAMVSQDKIKGVFAGQPVEVSLYAFPERSLEGKVVLVKPTVDNQTRLVSVIVRVENPKLEIMPGMNGIARLQSTREALRAPSVAVMSTKGESRYVFVVDKDSAVHLRPVVVGIEADGYVEIQSGLNAGDRVVVVGQAALGDNDAVRIGSEYATTN